MFLKPAPGINVPDPDRGGLLPPEGRDVPPSTYWYNRVAVGDAIESEAPATPTTSVAVKPK